MRTYDDALGLATSLVRTANDGGVKCESLITRMDYPLGRMVGNANEVWECIEAMTPGSIYTKILDKISYDPGSKSYL